jgi:hypothetical protein
VATIHAYVVYIGSTDVATAMKHLVQPAQERINI